MANKNAEGVVNKTNKTYSPSGFGKYYATTQSFRLSISGTNSAEISRSLQNDASRAELLSKADGQVLGLVFVEIQQNGHQRLFLWYLATNLMRLSTQVNVLIAKFFLI